MTTPNYLDKLIRVCSIITLHKAEKPIKSQTFENILENGYSFHPHQQQFDTLSDWQYIYDVLFSGESALWFRYDEAKDTMELLVKIPKLVLPAHQQPFGTDEEMLKQLTTLQLAAAYAKTRKCSVNKVRNMLNTMLSQFKEREKSISTPQPPPQKVTPSPPPVKSTQPPPPLTVNSSLSSVKDIVLVNTAALAEQFLANMSKFNTKIIGLDCEGVNLGINGVLTVVQISAHDIQYIFDMKLKNSTIIEVVKKVLQDESILKVIHDCENDLCGLYKDFDMIVSSIVDTSIFYRLLHQNQRNISLNELCALYNVPGNAFKDLGKKLHKKRVWGMKNFTKEMLDYASGDVRTLIQLSQAMTPSLEEDAKKILDQIDSEVKLLWESTLLRMNAKNKTPAIGTSQSNSEKTQNIEISQQDVAILPYSDFNVTIVNQIYSFLDLFPKKIQEQLSTIAGEDVMNLIEVVMDKGRPYELFYYHKKESHTDNSFIVKQEEIDEVVTKLSFGTDNRAGIDGSLHRISSILNRSQQIIGLTLRVGRAVLGRSKVFADLIEQGKSILLLGKPGAGKTTFIRDFAKTFAELRRVVVVDTSCEIGGFGDIPHVAIGKARRMQVADIRRQQEVMIQAVQNHTPEVIVIDEIGTREEVSTARTIAQRGICLCGSAHGDMKSILKNPILCDLLGGVESVIMGDRYATKDGEKMRLQLKADPVFDVVIQLPDDNSCNEWKIFTNLRQTVMDILAKRPYSMEVRKLTDGKVVSSIVRVE